MAALKICVSCKHLGTEDYHFCPSCLLKKGEVYAYVTETLLTKIIGVCETKRHYDKADYYQTLVNIIQEQIEDGQTII